MSHRGGPARHPYQVTQIHQSSRRAHHPRIVGGCERSTSGDSSGGFASPIYHSPLPALDDDDEYDVVDVNRHRYYRHRHENDPAATIEQQRRRSSRRTSSSRSQQRCYYFVDAPPVASAQQASFHGRVYPGERRPGDVRRFENERLCVADDIEVARRKYTLAVDARDAASNCGANSPTGGGLTGRGAVDGCGGHCIAFQNFCYYFLQVVFAIGILAGVSLCIAGSVLRRNRGKDLSVLVYIGCLTSAVCAALLCIQYCVRRNVERRKRTLQAAIDAAAASMIPMADVVAATFSTPVVFGPPRTVHDIAVTNR